VALYLGAPLKNGRNKLKAGRRRSG